MERLRRLFSTRAMRRTISLQTRPLKADCRLPACFARSRHLPWPHDRVRMRDGSRMTSNDSPKDAIMAEPETRHLAAVGVVAAHDVTFEEHNADLPTIGRIEQ